ncbi:deoxyuridine 5'-triphosphate nucleotidohydrolase [Mycena polygramma]|nr:deoxyuridine 5'-triphosphate nucleotidohydrolase [Mycena polygramma]
MILSGRAVFSRQIVQNLISAQRQVQPCGIDLSLKRVLAWTSAGVVDFDNTFRKTADTIEIPFEGVLELRLHLRPGAYLVEFNETIDVPLDVMGSLYVRSSLFRSGALVSAGGMLQVVNPHGLTLYKNAKLAQFVFHEMKEKVDGYSGVYQNKTAM